MNRNTNLSKRFPNYYNHYVLDEKRKQEGYSFRRLAAELNMDRQTITRAFRGTATQKQVWPIANFFHLDWKLLHDLSLPASEFHRAVLSGGSRSVR